MPDENSPETFEKMLYSVVTRALPIGSITTLLAALTLTMQWLDNLGYVIVALSIAFVGFCWAMYVNFSRTPSKIHPATKVWKFSKEARFRSASTCALMLVGLPLPLMFTGSEPKPELEISGFDFTDDYTKASTQGRRPEFDLKLRNTSEHPVLVTELCLVVEQSWTLRPTTFPKTRSQASLILPSAVYDIEVGETQHVADLLDENELDATFVSLDTDPRFEDAVRKVAHEVPVGGTDLIRVRYIVNRLMRIFDPSAGQEVDLMAIAPFYIIKLSVQVTYNNGASTHSNPLLFAHHYSSDEEPFLTDHALDDDWADQDVPPLAVRYSNNRQAIEEIRELECQKSPSVDAAIMLTERNMQLNSDSVKRQ